MKPISTASAQGFARVAPGKTQRGATAVEFAMVFPLFFAIFYAIITWSLIFVAQQNLTLAAEEGARAALNFQLATTIPDAVAARASAACVAAKGLVSKLVKTADCATTSNTCSYDPTSTMTCIVVTLTYHYSKSPLLPTLPLLGWSIPNDLSSTATVQLNPVNIL